MILSSGAVPHLQHLQSTGKEVILCVAIRFEQEGVLKALEAFRRNDRVLDIDAIDLAKLALGDLHLEAQKFQWQSRMFARYPYNVIWPVSDGAVIHSFSWAPLLLDYSGISHHDETSFDTWTLDGDYVSKNFSSCVKRGTVEVVSDSRDLTLVSLTPKNDLTFIPETVPTRRPAILAMPFLGDFIRRMRIRIVFNSASTDSFKRTIFPIAVHLYSERENAASNRPQVSNVAKQIIASAIAPSFFYDLTCSALQNGIYATLNFLITSCLVIVPKSWRRRARRILTSLKEKNS